jgi:hypothetical protein
LRILALAAGLALSSQQVALAQFERFGSETPAFGSPLIGGPRPFDVPTALPAWDATGVSAPAMPRVVATPVYRGAYAGAYTGNYAGEPGVAAPQGAAAGVTPPIGASPVTALPRVPEEIVPEGAFDYDPTNCGDGRVKRIPDFKSGFFQKLSLTGTWMPSFDETDVGFTDFEALTTVALPAPSKEWPLLITPSYRARFLDGPVSPDLPARLYDAQVQFRWLPKLTERLRVDLAIEPGVHTDFETNDADAFRTPGRGLGIFDLNPTYRFVLGVLYLDREDLSLIPAGGVMITPNEDWQLDLIFPEPKIAQRLWADGNTEYWQYIAAEFGSGPYSIRRADGRQDVIILSDYRLLYGVERKRLGGIWTKIEAGYVFGREIEFVSNDPRYEPSPTLLLRAGVTF